MGSARLASPACRRSYAELAGWAVVSFRVGRADVLGVSFERSRGPSALRPGAVSRGPDALGPVVVSRGLGALGPVAGDRVPAADCEAAFTRRESGAASEV